jgi:acyl-CoA thioesterase
MSDIWNDPPPVHYDNEERFGTASEMIAEIRRLRAEREATCRRLAAAMHEVSFGSATQVFDLAESALKHWHQIVHQSNK